MHGGGHKGALRNEQLFVGLVGVQQASHLPPSPQSHFTPHSIPPCFIVSFCCFVLFSTFYRNFRFIFKPRVQLNPKIIPKMSRSLKESLLFLCYSNRETLTCDCITSTTILARLSFSLLWMGTSGQTLDHISAFIWGARTAVMVVGCMSASKDSTHVCSCTRKHTHTLWSNCPLISEIHVHIISKYRY